MKKVYLFIATIISLLLITTCDEPNETDSIYGFLEGYTYYSGSTIPVSGVTVNIESEYYTTSTDGTYILNNIPVGNKILTATKDGYDQYQTTITIEENGTSINIPMTSALHTHNLYGTIVDNDQQSMSNVTVTVLNDDSTESQLQTTSDASGYYQIPTVAQGQRKIKFHKQNYETFVAQIFISNSDYQYNAQLENLLSTVTDIDGNTYQTLLIGDQRWMIENLKVTHYRNGDSIATGYTSSDWSVLSSGAYAVYGDNESNADTYGYLYNWHVVEDIRNIAPVGWHVPTVNEWQTLVDYLGGFSVAGNKAKEAGTTHWNSPNTGATNESGFTALPGGIRTKHGGGFDNMGEGAYFWSDSECDGNTETAWHWFMYSFNSEMKENNFHKSFGTSIRCIRNY
jgi:uncharacterized protein (TIGR02145 family)